MKTAVILPCCVATDRASPDLTLAGSRELGFDLAELRDRNAALFKVNANPLRVRGAVVGVLGVKLWEALLLFEKLRECSLEVNNGLLKWL